MSRRRVYLSDAMDQCAVWRRFDAIAFGYKILLRNQSVLILVQIFELLLIFEGRLFRRSWGRLTS
jgi:hypothetical protein